MPRSIPKWTMVDKWKKEMASMDGEGFGIGIGEILKPKRYRYISEEASYKPKVYKKPRQWSYITKPFFRKIKEPLVDVFKEADEVDIIIDLGGFDRSEVFYGIKGNTYIINGIHQDFEFKQEIPLPMRVDINRIEEHYKNDILEIILPKKKEKIKEKRKTKTSKKSG